jgi:hypothetical protein
MIKAKRISTTTYNNAYQAVGRTSESSVSMGISGKSLARSIAEKLLTKWRKMTSQIERLFQ